MYHPIMTHDIDRFFKWHSFKSLAGELRRKINNQSRWGWLEMISSYLNAKAKDPFSNLNRLIDINNEFGIDTVFYIMTTEELDPLNINDYTIEDIKSQLFYILEQGAEIGLHPGIKTSTRKDLLLKQKENLEQCLGQRVIRSRQHYLKYDPKCTFKYLMDIGIENDSSIYPTNKSNTYPLINNGHKILHETPLVFMDTHYMDKSDKQILKSLEKSLAPAKENRGEVMILWHNNNISNKREERLYKRALELIVDI